MLTAELVSNASRAASDLRRGRDPEVMPSRSTNVDRDLFRALIPEALWARIRGASRVFLVPHRSLHHLPFEMLGTGEEDGKAKLWIDVGPPISYLPSGSVLHWLRERKSTGGGHDLDVLAVGDPEFQLPAVPPEQGVLVSGIDEGGQAESRGLRARDVLLRYGGSDITDATSLRTLRDAIQSAIASGRRDSTPVPVEVWRNGVKLDIELAPGPLGVRLALGSPRAAYLGSFDSTSEALTIQRAGDIERLRRLPPLRGARQEAESIAKLWREGGRSAQCLTGKEGSEPAVFQSAGGAGVIHFACHGIAEEYARQSFSMLVLALPDQVQRGDDGLLKLRDLMSHWRGHLEGCQLVVLSACRTNVGPTQRDDGPQALPIGFFGAGAASVVSSLWAVDDGSTQELMVDFHRRLLAGEDRMSAFTAAKKALRSRYADPYYWAPFLFLGNPD